MNYQNLKQITNILSTGLRILSSQNKLFDIKAKQFLKEKNCAINSFPDETKELHNLLTKAEKEFEKQEYRYSLFWSRIVLEKSLKQIVLNNEDEFYKDSIFKNLVEVEKKDIFDGNFLYHLHMTRRICNKNDHEIENEYGGIGAHYAIEQLKKLVAYIDDNLNRNTSSEVLAYE